MLERITIVDQPPSHEAIQPAGYYAALQPRLLLTGGALNPDNKTLTAVTAGSFIPLDQRDYGIFQQGSLSDRRGFWQGKEDNDFARQKAAWVTSTVETFTKGRGFFTNSQEGQKWNRLFISLGIEAVGFNATSAESLYSKYFRGQDADSSLKKFVKDVLDKTDKKEDGSIDYAKLRENLPAVQWLANVFGETSSEVVTQLVDSEARLQDQEQRQLLVEQANQAETVNNSSVLRINQLNGDEERILRFIWNQPRQIQPRPPIRIEPPATPSPQEIQTEEAVFPSRISPEDNLHAAMQFIRVVRDPNRYAPIPPQNPGDPPISRHEFGMILPGNNIPEGWFYPHHFTDLAEQRYHMPFAIYSTQRHAMVLLKAPYQDQTDAQWKALIYDPGNPGEREVVLPEYVPQTLQTADGQHAITANNLARAEIQNGTYDISVSGHPELTPYMRPFIEDLKLRQLQYDGWNCVPYSFFVNTMLQALRTGDSEFKRTGIPQYARDFGIRVLTFEEVFNQTGQTATQEQTDSTPRPIDRPITQPTTEAPYILAAGNAGGLVEQVNTRLGEHMGNAAVFEMQTETLDTYLRTLTFSIDTKQLLVGTLDAKVTQAKSQFIDDRRLQTSATLSASKAIISINPSFKAVLETDPNDRIVVIGQPEIEGLPNIGNAKEKLNEYIQNLHDILTQRINERLDPSWEVAGFRIADLKISVRFKRKAADQNQRQQAA